MNPIISVFVPTKNRYKYLKGLINLVESFHDSRIELVVQDNSDSNLEILDFFKGRKLLSTVYYYDSSPLTMSGNSSLAISHCRGKFVCMIGDDDAVCRNIADCAEWMEKNDIDVVRSLYVQYSWNEALGNNCGSVYYDKITKNIKLGNPLKELKSVLKNGVPNFQRMTKLYHGIVKKSLLDEVIAYGGTLFPGPTPDMSSAVTISFFVKKYAMIEIPVVLPGMSRMVGGGVQGKVLKLDEVKFISDKDRNNWEKDFPKLWATELIWPDCALKALRYVKHEEYIKFFNRDKMLSRLVVVNRNYFKEALHYSKNKLKFLFTFISYFLSEGIKYIWGKKILARINGKVNGHYCTKKGFSSISECESFLMNELSDFSFKNIKIIE